MSEQTQGLGHSGITAATQSAAATSALEQALAAFTGTEKPAAPAAPRVAEQAAPASQATSPTSGMDAREEANRNAVYAGETPPDEAAAAAPVNPEVAALQRQFDLKFEQLRRENARLEAKAKASSETQQKYNELVRKIEEARLNPKKAPSLLGMSEQDYLARALAAKDDQLTPETQLALDAKREMEEMRAWRAQQQEEMAAQSQVQALKAFELETLGFLQSAPQFELLHSKGQKAAAAEIMTAMQEHVNRTGEVPGYQQIAEALESNLEREITEKYLRTKKIQAKLGAEAAPGKPVGKTPRTLSASMTPATKPGRGPLTESERMAEVLRLWEQSGS